jgi:alkaline phosphatase
MVEGARIDHAHHDGFANRALEETLGFEEALAATISLLKESNQLDEVMREHKLCICTG